jgi:hypothetical protein
MWGSLGLRVLFASIDGGRQTELPLKVSDRADDGFQLAGHALTLGPASGFGSAPVRAVFRLPTQVLDSLVADPTPSGFTRSAVGF